MVSITAEIHPPAEQTKTRKMFAFGLIKINLSTSSACKQTPTDELRVLGLLVVEEQAAPTQGA